eukprot:scaffold3620_cov417-Prasinococcus_capsulatus_cf.AAC.5
MTAPAMTVALAMYVDMSPLFAADGVRINTPGLPSNPNLMNLRMDGVGCAWQTFRNTQVLSGYLLGHVWGRLPMSSSPFKAQILAPIPSHRARAHAVTSSTW